MPLFGSSSPFDQDVEKITNEANTSEDWGLIMDICDKINATPNSAKDALKSIKKRLKSPVPHVAIQTITLLNACVSNCGRLFQLEVSSSEFCAEARNIISKGHPKVAEKLKQHLQEWAEEYKNEPALSLLVQLYNSLKSEGQTFPAGDSKLKQKPLKEDGDLQGQLEELKTKHADTVKRLEEAQTLMLTFKSKNAELEEELHHTKLNLAAQQEEVERLKNELGDGKKQSCLGNEPVEESMESYSGDASSPAGMTEFRSLEDFGKFQFHLSSYLTRDIIRDLTLVLAFSPTESEEAEDDKIKFIRLLRGKGLISPTDIIKLTNALDEIGQHGVLNAVKNLFDRNPSEAFR